MKNFIPMVLLCITLHLQQTTLLASSALRKSGNALAPVVHQFMNQQNRSFFNISNLFGKDEATLKKEAEAQAELEKKAAAILRSQEQEQLIEKFNTKLNKAGLEGVYPQFINQIALIHTPEQTAAWL